MRKPKFISDSRYLYHVYNRGVEKRKIFLDKQDHLRFIHDLFEFNDASPATKFSTFGNFAPVSSSKTKKRELIVEILAFCLMPNHFHLLLRQLRDNGIVDFMQKLGTGYSMYFNEKNERSGALFQGTYKAVMITNDRHFLYLPYYIHLNPLDLVMPKWREGKISYWKKADQFLETYRWSSYPDYIGKKNFPSIISTKFLRKLWRGPKDYRSSMQYWLKSIDLKEVGHLLLE